MRAIIVCVEYWDYLSVCLPYNIHHFDEVLVVTSHLDTQTQNLCRQLKVPTFVTDAFYRGGAMFNKWLALEEGLDHFGRHDWICILDADIAIPQSIELPPLIIGNLYGPHRRMGDQLLPPEDWKSLRLWPLEEFSGYFQLFHGSDPHLPTPPWHQTNWKHAGGADTFFQELWPVENRVRLTFEVLHIGPNGVNWCGRTTKLAGKTPDNAIQRKQSLTNFMNQRRKLPKNLRNYDNEKLQ